MLLSEYIKLPREERIAHIDLSTPCVRIDLTTVLSKSDICDFLSVEDDIDNWQVGKVHKCHLCECGTGKGNCENPLHIYLGSVVENQADISPEAMSAKNRHGAWATQERGVGLGSREVQREMARRANEKNRREKLGCFFDPSIRPFWISTVTGHISQAKGAITHHNKAKGGTKDECIRLERKDAELLLRLGASRFKSKNGRVNPPFNTGVVK